jgi:hypothetical protein
MFVPPQRRKHPIVILLALAIMVFALVYLFVARHRQRVPPKSPEMQQLQQQSRAGSIITLQ